jgi:predicted ATPase
VTLLERKTVLDALAEIAAQARSGEGRLLMLEGEAGVGKSTLLEQFTHDLPDSRLLSGACDGMFTPRPLGPLFDIAQQAHGRLHSLCREPQPAGVRGGAPHHGQRDDIHEAFLTLACAIICWRRTAEPLALLGPLRRQRLLSAGYQSAGYDYQRLRMCTQARQT